MLLARCRQAREWRVLAWCGVCCGGVGGWLVISMSNMIDTLQCNIVIAWLPLRVCIASGNIITPNHALLCHEIIKQQLFIISNWSTDSCLLNTMTICRLPELQECLQCCWRQHSWLIPGWQGGRQNILMRSEISHAGDVISRMMLINVCLIIVGVSCHKDLGGEVWGDD